MVNQEPSAHPSLPDAVLFDLDGTLVDTEPYWIGAEHELVAAHGGTWTDADAHLLVGNALIRSAEILRERGGVDLDPPEIVDLLIARVIARVRDAVPWRPGARELLAGCRTAGIPTALVTMSYRSLADAVVSQLPAGSFDVLVTGDEVVRGKPHPEAYLLACERLGVRPGRSVALEDSPTGAASAGAAGCVTVAIPHHVPVPVAPGLTIVPTLSGVTIAQLGALVPR